MIDMFNEKKIKSIVESIQPYENLRIEVDKAHESQINWINSQEDKFLDGLDEDELFEVFNMVNTQRYTRIGCNKCIKV